MRLRNVIERSPRGLFAKIMYYAGLVLIGAPLLICFLVVVTSAINLAYLYASGQPIPQMWDSRGMSLVSRFETRVEGNEYFVKFHKAPDFEKVTKENFHLAIKRENKQRFCYYLMLSLIVCVPVGALLVATADENCVFASANGYSLKGLRSLEVLAEERGIKC